MFFARQFFEDTLLKTDGFFIGLPRLGRLVHLCQREPKIVLADGYVLWIVVAGVMRVGERLINSDCLPIRFDGIVNRACFLGQLADLAVIQRSSPDKVGSSLSCSANLR